MSSSSSTPTPTPPYYQTTFLHPQASSSQTPTPSRPSSPSRPLLPPTSSSRRIANNHHPGCPLCSLVSSIPDETPSHTPQSSTSTTFPTPTSRYDTQASPPRAYPQPTRSGGLMVSGREILYHDEDITVYPAIGKERLCGDGKHLIIVLNRHLERIYDLGVNDVPILSNIIHTATRLLPDSLEPEEASGIRIGFVGTIARDPQLPHAHLHAHALFGPVDTSLPGCSFWRRNVVFGAMNWWSVEDLRAEIREESSNNRVKSGYSHRGNAPIDRVPDAASIAGLPNALEPDPYHDSPGPTPTKTNYTSQPMDRGRGQSSSSSGKTAMREPPALPITLAPPPKRSTSVMSDGSSTGSLRDGEDGEGYSKVDLDEAGPSRLRS